MNLNQPFASLLEAMVTQQIERRGIHEARLLQALRAVPRHHFVPEHLRGEAYDDCPLPIGYGQTISQPYIVALMSELLELNGTETVLEIGTGSGFQAAILGHLAEMVHTVERIPELAEHAQQVLADLELANVHVHLADGSLGWAQAAPYQAIVVTAAAPRAPQPLFDQLAEHGRLVIPVGSRFSQELQLWTRHDQDYELKHVIPVAFVPLRGAYGWQENEWWQ
jgi:protein-L-isoaspartate(D-aspartate) O-methyltransferase